MCNELLYGYVGRVYFGDSPNNNKNRLKQMSEKMNPKYACVRVLLAFQCIECVTAQRNKKKTLTVFFIPNFN